MAAAQTRGLGSSQLETAWTLFIHGTQSFNICKCDTTRYCEGDLWKLCSRVGGFEKLTFFGGKLEHDLFQTLTQFFLCA